MAKVLKVYEGEGAAKGAVVGANEKVITVKRGDKTYEVVAASPATALSDVAKYCGDQVIVAPRSDFDKAADKLRALSPEERAKLLAELG